MRLINFGKDKQALVFLILLTALTRIAAVFHIGSFNYDEMFSVHFASMHLSEMLGYLSGDIHPPLYYIILNFWIKLWGSGEFAVRCLSLIFTVFSVAPLYLLVKRLFGKTTAILSVLVFIFSPFQFFTGLEARMYSLLMFLGLFSLWFFYATFVEKNIKWFWFYFVATLLMLFANLGGYMIIAVEWLWFILLFARKLISKYEVKRFIFSQFVIMTLWLVWFWFFLMPQISTRLSSDWFYNADIERSFISGIFDFFFLYLDVYWLRVFTATVIFSAPFIVLIWNSQKVRIKELEINSGWFALLWLLPTALCMAVSQISLSRVFSLGLISLYILVAHSINLTLRSSRRAGIALITLWFLISIYAVANMYSKPFGDWPSAISWLEDRVTPQRPLYISCFVHELQFLNYNSRITDFSGLYLDSDDLSLQERVINKNCFSAVNSNNINNLAPEISAYREMIVLYEYQEPDRYFDSLLNQNLSKDGWLITDIFDAGTRFGPKAVEYKRIN